MVLILGVSLSSIPKDVLLLGPSVVPAGMTIDFQKQAMLVHGLTKQAMRISVGWPLQPASIVPLD